MKIEFNRIALPFALPTHFTFQYTSFDGKNIFTDVKHADELTESEKQEILLAISNSLAPVPVALVRSEGLLPSAAYALATRITPKFTALKLPASTSLDDVGYLAALLEAKWTPEQLVEQGYLFKEPPVPSLEWSDWGNIPGGIKPEQLPAALVERSTPYCARMAGAKGVRIREFLSDLINTHLADEHLLITQGYIHAVADK